MYGRKKWVSREKWACRKRRVRRERWEGREVDISTPKPCGVQAEASELSFPDERRWWGKPTPAAISISNRAGHRGLSDNRPGTTDGAATLQARTEHRR